MRSDYQIPPVSLALSGGGALGFAHIGVIKALQECAVPILEIAGTSFGAMVGAMAASGLSTDEMIRFSAEIDRSKALALFIPSLSKGGWTNGAALSELLRRQIPKQTFEACNIPLTTCSVCLETAQLTYFSQGDLISAILASTAIPAIFQPIQIGRFHYIDGGVLENIPLGAFAKTQQPVSIASDVLFSAGTRNEQATERPQGRFSARTIGIMALHTMLRDQSVKLIEKYKPDLALSLDLESFRIWEFWRGPEIIDAGYKQALPLIKQWTEHYLTAEKEKPPFWKRLFTN